jgi:hypothetical protein
MELGKIPQRKAVRDGRFGGGGAPVLRSEPVKKSCKGATNFNLFKKGGGNY